MTRFNVPPPWQPYLPNSFTPAPDWKPDPSWGMPPAGWVLWTDEATGEPAHPPYEYAQNPYLNVTTIPLASTDFSQSAFAAPAKKSMSKGAKIGIGIVAVALFGAIIGSCGGGDKDTPAAASPSASESQTAAPVASPTPSQTVEEVVEETDSPEPEVTEQAEPEPEAEPEVKMPADQRKFSDIVAKASAKYTDTDNELKASKTIIDRDKSLCKSTGGDFKGWRATVHDVGSTGDGYGYIAVIMEDDIELSTWNNAMSDAFDNTLIKPSNKLYDVLMELSSGDEVTIAGNFIKGDKTCVETSNLTEVMNAASPDFKVNFTSVKAN